MKRPLARMATIAIVALLQAEPLGAVFLDIVPDVTSVTAGASVDVGVVIGALSHPPSVGAFDLSVGFDPALLFPSAVSFGPFLGDPLAFEAVTDADLSIPGVVEFAELSLLSPSELDALQPSSFTLATLSFTGVASGTARLSLIEPPRIDDAFGHKIPIPEPASLPLLILGWIALRVVRWQRPYGISSPPLTSTTWPVT